MAINERGITLIALVVTIVVLLILAGVSISMLTGENGIIKQASNAKDATEQAKVEELVDLAVNSIIGENKGTTNGITPEMIADEVNEMENRSDVYAEENTFPTKIIFPDEKREVEIDLPQKENLDEIYNENIEESQIVPTEIFDYEIINEAEIGAVNLNNLPTKEVRITRIKPEYCNFGGYNPDTGSSITDTNYEITLKDGTKIEDLLIIPYQVEGKYVENGIEGEIYKITEVNIGVYWQIKNGSDGYGVPSNIKKIIYPNTVRKIKGNSSQSDRTNTISQIILSDNLKEIGDHAISGYDNLISLKIPNSVTKIGVSAFSGCRGLTNIEIPNGITSIELGTFNYCTELTSVTIPNSVINIERFAFNECNNLTTVNYLGTKAQWNAISIGSGNVDLTNATIHCIDGDINP